MGTQLLGRSSDDNQCGLTSFAYLEMRILYNFHIFSCETFASLSARSSQNSKQKQKACIFIKKILQSETVCVWAC